MHSTVRRPRRLAHAVVERLPDAATHTHLEHGRGRLRRTNRARLDS
jgi:hypothetical protein